VTLGVLRCSRRSARGDSCPCCRGPSHRRHPASALDRLRTERIRRIRIRSYIGGCNHEAAFSITLATCFSSPVSWTDSNAPSGTDFFWSALSDLLRQLQDGDRGNNAVGRGSPHPWHY
jgi:hypothetical protein